MDDHTKDCTKSLIYQFWLLVPGIQNFKIKQLLFLKIELQLGVDMLFFEIILFNYTFSSWNNKFGSEGGKGGPRHVVSYFWNMFQACNYFILFRNVVGVGVGNFFKFLMVVHKNCG